MSLIYSVRIQKKPLMALNTEYIFEKLENNSKKLAQIIDFHSKFIYMFYSEAPPDLSARAKKNHIGDPSFAERKTHTNENQRPATQAWGKRWQGSATP